MYRNNCNSCYYNDDFYDDFENCECGCDPCMQNSCQEAMPNPCPSPCACQVGPTGPRGPRGATGTHQLTKPIKTMPMVT